MYLIIGYLSKCIQGFIILISQLIPLDGYLGCLQSSSVKILYICYFIQCTCLFIGEILIALLKNHRYIHSVYIYMCLYFLQLLTYFFLHFFPYCVSLYSEHFGSLCLEKSGEYSLVAPQYCSSLFSYQLPSGCFPLLPNQLFLPNLMFLVSLEQ